MDDNKEIHDGSYFINILARLIALLTAGGLFVADRGMGLIDPPVPEAWYPGLFAFALGGQKIIEMFGLKFK